MKNGWVKLYRKSMENELYFSEPFTRWQAWLDLILIANHKPGTIIKRGNTIKVDRGVVGYSQLALGDRWRWSRGKVSRFLNRLESESKIVQQKSRLTTLIKVINYDIYQLRQGNRRATDGQQTDINKNVKNVKKKTYGEFNNVFLSDLEFKKLKEKFNSTTYSKIE